MIGVDAMVASLFTFGTSDTSWFPFIYLCDSPMSGRQVQA